MTLLLHDIQKGDRFLIKGRVTGKRPIPDRTYTVSAMPESEWMIRFTCDPPLAGGITHTFLTLNTLQRTGIRL